MASPAAGRDAAGLAGEAREKRLVFGKYKILRRIGRGGMGEVYLASLVGELGFEKRLVIKTILPELARKPKFVEMFAAEAKTAVSLSHGNIVPIYELGKADETLYIVMGYVDGPSVERMLAAYRKRSRPPSTALSLFVVRQVLTGLAYAHTEEPGRAAVVHRDVSPRNVLVDRSGQVRLVDFGIAVPANVTTVVRGGSAGYMAPEQARAELADPRADVFSTACMLYELLTLNKAFPKAEVWAQPDLDDLPEDLRPMLERAMSLEPLRRPADAGAFLTALAPALAQHAATMTDTMLAAHLRALFPSGWERDDDTPDPDQLTPVTNVEPLTYATRLTEVTGASKPLQRSKKPGARGKSGAGARDDDDRRTGLLWPAVAVLALGSLTIGALATMPSGNEVTEAAAPSGGEPDGRRDPPRDPPSTPPPVEPPPADSSDAPPDSGAALPAGADGGPTPPEAAPAIVSLKVTPADAMVKLGDKVLAGGPPYEIPVPAQGEAVVQVQRAGYLSQSLKVQAGESARPHTITLEPRGKGKLQVYAKSVAWAEVRVAGKKRGATPTPPLELPAGHHRVVVKCVPDVCETPRVLLDTTVTVKAGETTTVTAE